MSRWGIDSLIQSFALSSVDSATSANGGSTATGPDTKAFPGESSTGPGPGNRMRLVTPPWVRVAPFFVSALFFLSALFSVLSPLPLLVLYFRAGRKWAWLAAGTNATLVAFTGGLPSLAIYSVFVLTLALGLSELLARRRSLEKSVALTLLLMVIASLLWIMGYAHFQHLNPWSTVHEEVHAVVDAVSSSVASNSSLLGAAGGSGAAGDVDDMKQSLLEQFPTLIGVLALMMIWVNSLILLKLNTGSVRSNLGLDAQFARKWKAPDLLIWPSIAAFALMLFDFGRVSVYAANVFNILMAVYALQGLSILGFVFEVWKVRSFLRTVGFSVSVFLMMPLLLCLGFFDLWFDFRGKFRQA